MRAFGMHDRALCRVACSACGYNLAMHDNNLTGHPSDYGSRTLEDEERLRAEHGKTNRTADGEPLTERGTAPSAKDPEEPAPPT